VGLRGIERRLEQMVEGTFARVFKSGVRPVEIGRRLVREMDDRRSIGVSGRPVASAKRATWALTIGQRPILMGGSSTTRSSPGSPRR